MLSEHLETQVRSLSRQEKYLLIQVLIDDLKFEEPDHTHALGVQRPAMTPLKMTEVSKSQPVDTFLKKWKGALKDVDADVSKLKGMASEQKKEKRFSKQYDDLDSLFGRWSEGAYERIQQRIDRERQIDSVNHREHRDRSE